jgi:hypothetical protein
MLDDDRPPARDIVAIVELIASHQLEIAAGVRVK